MTPPIITLTTDFGASDAFVASMKGVILAINRSAVLVDVSHDIPPQDIPHGAFVLQSAYRYFPTDSIHIAIVDPGVGTARHAVLLVTPQGRFLAPDNGLLTYVVADHQTLPRQRAEVAPFLRPFPAPVPGGCLAFALSRPEYWLEPVSDTFHGRDIFAPVAAHLSLDLPPEALGDPVDHLTCLNVGPKSRRGPVQEGRIICVDRYGNLATNLRRADLPGNSIRAEVGGVTVCGPARTYADSDGLSALIGSHGYLEIAQKNGSAAVALGIKVGDRVSVQARDEDTEE